MKYFVTALCFAIAMSAHAQPLPPTIQTAGVSVAEYNEVADELGLPTIVTSGALPPEIQDSGVTVAEWAEMLRRWKKLFGRDEDDNDRRRGF